MDTSAINYLIMKIPKHYISEIPSLLKEWNWNKNKGISPYSIGCGSSKKIWWKCSACGNEWEATPNSRSGSKKYGNLFYLWI